MLIFMVDDSVWTIDNEAKVCSQNAMIRMEVSVEACMPQPTLKVLSIAWDTIFSLFEYLFPRMINPLYGRFETMK